MIHLIREHIYCGVFYYYLCDVHPSKPVGLPVKMKRFLGVESSRRRVGQPKRERVIRFVLYFISRPDSSEMREQLPSSNDTTFSTLRHERHNIEVFERSRKKFEENDRVRTTTMGRKREIKFHSF